MGRIGREDAPIEVVPDEAPLTVPDHPATQPVTEPAREPVPA